jgi:molybdate transport system substrate-binding protein
MVFAGMAYSASSMAAPTQCTVVDGSGNRPSILPPDLTIAVASNFYGPAQDLSEMFINSGPSVSVSAVRVCQNSTGTLDQEIRGTLTPPFGPYSLFLAANQSTPTALAGTAFVPSGATAFQYANGIPVLFTTSSSVATDVHTFIPTLPAGVGPQAYTITSAVSSSLAISTSAVQPLAVANPALAPYGDATFKILSAMSLVSYTATPPTPPSPLPSWMHSPLYDNIDLTFSSVPSPNPAGFVSKSQICPLIKSFNPSLVYIGFEGYPVAQSGILIDSGDSTQNSIAAALRGYISTLQTTSTGTGNAWGDFLVDHCYMHI